MYALAEDSRNDVASNIVALVCGLIGMFRCDSFHNEEMNRCSSFQASNALRGKIKQEAIVVDPIGAIVISVYIIIAWILQANSN